MSYKKRCSKCGEEKCGLDFYLKNANDPSRGLQAWCKRCLSLAKKTSNLLRVSREKRADEEWEAERLEQIKQDRLNQGLE